MKSFLFLVVIILVANTHYAFAQANASGEEGDTLRELKLKEVKVTASPALQTKVIADVDIKLRPINTSQDMLKMVPGLFIAQHAGGGKAEQIFLRGFDIDHGTDIAITTDGMPVNMVSHAHGQGYSDLHFVIPETVDRIHFGKGPYHTHKGNLATAGYVGFQTFRSLDENTISFQVGEHHSYRGLAMLNLFQESNDRVTRNAYVAAEFNSTDGYFESPQDFMRINFFGKFNSSLGKSNYITISGSTFSSQWNASGQIPERAVESGMISPFGSIDDTEGGQTSRSNGNAQLTSTLKDQSYFKNQVYYSNYNFELYSNFTFFLRDTINGDQIRQKEHRNLFGYNGSYNREDLLFGKRTTSEIGIFLRHDFSKDNELTHTAHHTENIERMAFGDISETNLGAYWSATMLLMDRLTINTGLRYDHFEFGYADHLLNASLKKITDGIVSPKLNVFYQLSNTIQLSANIGYGFHSNDSRVVVQQQGVKTLPRAAGSDVGLLWKPFPNLLISTSLWWLHLDQEFVYVGDEAVVEPSGNTMRKGIEFSGRLEILPWLFADVDFNYTLAKAADEPDGLNFIPLAPKISSIGGLTVKSDHHWSGSFRYRFLGDRAANEDNSIIAQGYTIFDLLVDYRMQKVELGFAIENLFNTFWYEAQFDTESRLKDEVASVSEIHFTPGTTFNLKAHVSYYF